MALTQIASVSIFPSSIFAFWWLSVPSPKNLSLYILITKTHLQGRNKPVIAAPGALWGPLVSENNNLRPLATAIGLQWFCSTENSETFCNCNCLAMILINRQQWNLLQLQLPCNDFVQQRTVKPFATTSALQWFWSTENSETFCNYNCLAMIFFNKEQWNLLQLQVPCNDFY